MSKRIEKVNSLLEKEISNIIARDFDFTGAVVTVTHVDATANLIEARVYISTLPDERTDNVVATLNKAVSSIQKKINKLLKMRPIPRVIFVKDNHLQEAARVEELLSSLKKEGK